MTVAIGGGGCCVTVATGGGGCCVTVATGELCDCGQPRHVAASQFALLKSLCIYYIALPKWCST